MRSLFLLAVVAMLLGVGGVAMLKTDPGYLLISYGQHTVETSLWVGLVLIAAVVLLLYAVMRILHRLLSSPGSIAFWASARRQRTAERLTNRGLLSYIEGDFSKSHRQLQRGARHSQLPAFNHLMAARASLQLDDQQQMRADLESAMLADGTAVAAVELTQAELQLQAGQFERVLASLERAGSAARTPHALRMACKARLGLGDWEGLAELLPKLKKQSILPDAELARLEREIYRQLLEVAAGDLGGNTLKSLQSAWKRIPAPLQSEDAFLQRYVEMLGAAGDAEGALKLITRTLKKRWDPQLVWHFGRLAAANGQRQLATAEGWLADHEDDAQLLLCLGRLTARQELWGQARDYFERSVVAGGGDEACAELGRLLSASGDYTEAARVFCAGLALQANQLPELPLPQEAVPENRRLAAKDDGHADE